MEDEYHPVPADGFFRRAGVGSGCRRGTWKFTEGNNLLLFTVYEYPTGTSYDMSLIESIQIIRVSFLKLKNLEG